VIINGATVIPGLSGVSIRNDNSAVPAGGLRAP
jgi:hypothetical protein